MPIAADLADAPISALNQQTPYDQATNGSSFESNFSGNFSQKSPSAPQPQTGHGTSSNPFDGAFSANPLSGQQPDLFAGAAPSNYPANPTINPTSASQSARPSLGRSLGGLAAAAAIGFVAMIAWLLVVAFANVELGILAWGIGALIGVVAGVIACNPSPIYCSMVAAIAATTIIMAKLIMVLFVMILHRGVSFMENFSVLANAGNKYAHAFVDQALADNQFSESEKTLAQEFNAGYFDQDEGGEVESEEADTSMFSDEESIEFHKMVSKRVQEASELERLTWLENARRRHPDWIDNADHATAAKIRLLSQPEILSPQLKEHARYEIESQYGDGSESAELSKYVENLAPKELNDRTRQLRSECVKILRQQSEDQLDAMLIEAAVAYPQFNPLPDQFIAVAENISQLEGFQEGLKAHADLFLKNQLEGDEQYFKLMTRPDFQRNQLDFRKAVVQKMSSMDLNSRKQLVQSTQARYSKWSPPGREDFAINMPEEMDEIPEDLGDGSFVGSLKLVASPIDLLWLFLGASSAYGAARNRGQSAAAN